MEISSPPAVVPCGGSTESTLTGPPFWVQAEMRTQHAIEIVMPRARFIVIASVRKKATIAPVRRSVKDYESLRALFRSRRPEPASSDAFALCHRAPHLAERLLLQLTHALARESVLVADLLERPFLV